MDTEDETARSSTGDQVDRRWLVDTLMISYEKLDGLERALSSIPTQVFCTCHGALGPGGGLLKNLLVAEYPNDASGGEGCADVRAAVQIRVNTTTLMARLARMLVDVSVPGAVQEVDLAQVAEDAEVAMKAFTTNPTGAPADV